MAKDRQQLAYEEVVLKYITQYCTAYSQYDAQILYHNIVDSGVSYSIPVEESESIAGSALKAVKVFIEFYGVEQLKELLLISCNDIAYTYSTYFLKQMKLLRDTHHNECDGQFMRYPEVEQEYIYQNIHNLCIAICEFITMGDDRSTVIDDRWKSKFFAQIIESVECIMPISSLSFLEAASSNADNHM